MLIIQAFLAEYLVGVTGRGRTSTPADVSRGCGYGRCCDGRVGDFAMLYPGISGILGVPKT